MSDEYAINTDYAAMASWFELQSKKVKANAKIVDAALVGQDFMLHIDRVRPKKFIPMMPRSAGKTEDNTSARVTVSPNLIGCYIGFARGHDDFLSGSPAYINKFNGYKGGYTISALPFKHALQINNKLVYDAERSLEHWLVPYSKETLEYPSFEVGKLFVSEVTQKAISGKAPSMYLTIYIECTKTGGFKFNPVLHLDEGYYKAEVRWEKEQSEHDCTKTEDFKVAAVSKTEYDEVKKLSANMLDYKEPSLLTKPIYADW